VEWSREEWSGVVWSGVEWSGMVWCGVVWSGVGCVRCSEVVSAVEDVVRESRRKAGR
jgi:hypothetical protein